MAQRPGVQLTVEREADGGVSPNRFIPSISAHVRIYWPPLATRQQVIEALEAACGEAAREIDRYYGP